ncbi:cmet, partial [Drosophila busckii]
MSVKSSIQVCIKVRPVEPGQTVLWQVKEERSLQLIDGASEPCAFDYVFDQDCNNQKIFDCMASHIVEACIKGFNGTIFAYGQTSSGKTYTMMGDERNPGVMVLAVKEIFKQIAKQTDRDFLLRVGYIEIYNEKICDLLNKKNQDLKIHESSGMVNVNCEECIITSEEDMLRLLCLGNKERTVGETNMNERSSRSHAIFRIIIESRVTGGDADGAVNQSLLHLVDLAGSERADQTGARGARLKEGGHINKSLHFLSNVIKQLSENIDNRYICYRESKLTRILQASLGGNAFTSIICTIKPSIVEESNSTLSFAMRAKKIKLKPQLNENVSDATMMRRLERQIKTLEGQLAEEKRRNESQVKVSLLEQRIKTDTLKIISSHSLIDQRNRNRRRTWCPASTNLEPLPAVEASAQHKVSNLPKPTFYAEATEANLLKFSNLPKPSFYAGNVHPRIGNAPKTINIMKSLDIAEEEFKPAELHEFGQMPDSMISSQIQLTLTPCPEHLAPQNREKFERELIELQTFSKIEQHINTEWEDLTQKLTTATDKINELQNERADFTKRSNDLQAKVDSYEAQLSELKQTVQRLEMENRAAVDIEFQYESHKSRAERRESELLSAISEKESELLCIIAEKEHFQQTLNELSSEMLRNSKDAHMRSMCPDIESSCEQICNKCQELERMLEEYKQAQSNGKLAAQEKIECECEQLRVEIENTRARLESVQLLYEQMSSDVNERTERCERLSRDVVTAEQSKQSLQAKYVELEQSQQRQEAAWQAMQKDYEAIQLKYAKLQQDYALLERNTALCEQLQQQNEQLQQEITRLKQRVEQVQQQLLQAEEHKEQQTLAAELRARNEELLEKLQHIQAKFDDMQKEYDALSNDLMESVQEGDNLREQCTTLAAQLQQQQQQQAKPVELLTRLQQLEQEISAKNQLIESTECTIQEMREQMKTLEDALLEKSFIVSQVEDYKQQIETLEKHKAEMTLVYEELQEKVKENTINESLQLCNNNSQLDIKQEQLVSVQTTLYNMNGEVFELQAELKQQLSQLGSKNELIQRQQTELAELNERCISMDVQQVELQANVLAKQQQLDRQAEKSALDRTHIDELQACKAQLEETVAQLEQQLKQFQNMELQQQHKAELDAMQLDYLDKIEQSESGYRENLRKYNLEWKESKTEYEQRLEQLRMENAAFVEQLHALESEQKQQMSLERTASVENLKAAE